MFQNFHEIFKYLKVKYFIVHFYSRYTVIQLGIPISCRMLMYNSQTSQTRLGVHNYLSFQIDIAAGHLAVISDLT